MSITRYRLARLSQLLLFSIVVLCSGCSGIFVRTPIDLVSRDECSVAAIKPLAGCHFQRVLIIVLENQNYEDVSADPNFLELERKGAVFTDFHGLFHPSYSNYLAMVAGTEIRTFADWRKDSDKPTIASLLEAKGLHWKNYAEGYPKMPPNQCFKHSGLDRYARKHVPFLSFTSIQQHECQNIVPGFQFWDDLEKNKVPEYAFYSPNLDHDGHDPKDDPQRGLMNASCWLKAFLDRLRQYDLNNTLIIVTFDESRPAYKDNHTYTVFLGPMVRPGRYSKPYNHYNVLRTIEDNFGLGTLADGDGGAKVITDVWK